MTLKLSTPPGSPVAEMRTRLPSAWLTRLAAAWERLATVWFERQDRTGTVTLTTYLLSASSATIALFLSAGVVPFDPQLWSAAAWFLHRFSNVFWALPIALGLASDRRLPRLLAGFSIALAAAFYGWEWLPFGSSPSTPIKLAYIVSAAIIVLPAWLRQFWHRRQG